MSSPIANKLLSSLDASSRQSILARGVAVSLPRRFSFYESGIVPEFAYFITSGMASIVMTTEDGHIAEIGVVGREGVVGATELLGPATGPFFAFMQVEGTGIRVSMKDLMAEFDLRGALYQRVLEIVQVHMFAVSTLVACNLLHLAEARVARWLLTADDRVGPEALNLTQEFLGTMLGLRRTTVCIWTSKLEDQGLIYSARGRIKILDRARLELRACDCYQITKGLYGSLYLQAPSALRPQSQ